MRHSSTVGILLPTLAPAVSTGCPSATGPAIAGGVIGYNTGQARAEVLLEHRLVPQ